MSGFEKIIGYEDVKIELRRICDILCDLQKYEKLGVKMPKGLVLVGEPGVGKTTMAKAFIEETRRSAFVCRKKKPDGEFVKEIAEIFEQAKKSVPSIVFLDDMDKYANEDEDHKNAEEFVTVQSCIDDVKDLDIFVIATANSLNEVPDSLLRAGRFDKTIHIKNPKGKDAEDIIRFYLSQKEFVSDVDAGEIASILDGSSCAELETVINEAGIYAGYENKTKIDMDDLIRACIRVIYDAPEKSLDDGDDVDVIAYHEAGHAVITEVLAPGTVSLVSIKKNHGKIGGFATSSLPKGYWYSKKMMEEHVVSLLAGKAAIELIFDVVDVGAKSDIQRAFSIVERFVDDYCSNGFDCWIQGAMASNDLLSRREMLMAGEMERLYNQAKTILLDNKDCLCAVAKALIDDKVITRSRLKKLIDENIKKVS